MLPNLASNSRSALDIGHVIYLKERSFLMLKKDLILRNPLNLLGDPTEEIPQKGGFGAILARAGVGKTALVVQIALSSLLQNRNVLHVSLCDPVGKVSLWYEEVFRNIASRYEISEVMPLWESILTHRFIMTFQVDGFTAPKLQERIEELSEQGIFFPQIMLIDGLPFDGNVRGSLENIKEIARRQGIPVWFTVRTHRDQLPAADGFPPQLYGVSEMFDAIVQLQPERETVRLLVLKGGENNSTGAPLQLDPSTMLVTDAM
jgi:hypothetical protein